MIWLSLFESGLLFVAVCLNGQSSGASLPKSLSRPCNNRPRSNTNDFLSSYQNDRNVLSLSPSFSLSSSSSSSSSYSPTSNIMNLPYFAESSHAEYPGDSNEMSYNGVPFYGSGDPVSGGDMFHMEMEFPAEKDEEAKDEEAAVTFDEKKQSLLPVNDQQCWEKTLVALDGQSEVASNGEYDDLKQATAIPARVATKGEPKNPVNLRSDDDVESDPKTDGGASAEQEKIRRPPITVEIDPRVEMIATPPAMQQQLPESQSVVSKTRKSAAENSEPKVTDKVESLPEPKSFQVAFNPDQLASSAPIPEPTVHAVPVVNPSPAEPPASKFSDNLMTRILSNPLSLFGFSLFCFMGTIFLSYAVYFFYFQKVF